MATETHITKAERELARETLQERKDQHWAERGDRLERFRRGEAVPEVWPKDLYPLILHLLGRYMALVAEKPDAVWGVRALEDLVRDLGGAVDYGEAAARRLARRRFTQGQDGKDGEDGGR